ncbi:MAG: SHOCT domain-containing protein, partial [Mycobacterium sp.]
ARQQVQTIVRHAAAQQAAPPPVPAAASYVPPTEPTISERLQRLDTLRATGSISETEYTAKRQEIISEI